MTIVNFTPWHSLIGGILIGLASGLLLIFKGRVFGISGIAAGMLNRKSEGKNWRFAILAGLLCGGYLTHLLLNSPRIVNSVGNYQLIIAGIFVGFGTRLGSGCTSGHGVCGLSRLSFRSLVATLTFMGFGVLTMALENIF